MHQSDCGIVATLPLRNQHCSPSLKQIKSRNTYWRHIYEHNFLHSCTNTTYAFCAFHLERRNSSNWAVKWKSVGAGEPFPRNGNKVNQLFVLLLRFFTRRTPVDICSGIPACDTWKAPALPFWNREINKCPSDWFRIKKNTHTYATLDAPACARARLCRYNTLDVISAQPPVYMKGDNKRHMNSNKAQPQSINTSSSQSQCCNLNPLFKSCVCMRGCQRACAHSKKSNQVLREHHLQSGVKIRLKCQQVNDFRVN